MNRNLIILRGVPSAGKSTVAELIADKNSIILDPDDFFTDSDGNYNWIGEQLRTAHLLNQSKCKHAMENNIGKIIISSKNVKEKEFKPYLELAKEYNYKVFSLVIERRHDNKNDHNVPEEKVKIMEQKLRSSIKLL